LPSSPNSCARNFRGSRNASCGIILRCLRRSAAVHG
jgi:hypothetical protein